SWADNSGNEQGFYIERCQGAACSSFAQIDQVGADVTTYQNTGVSAGVSYSYRVRAYNVVGASGYSNEATGTTLLPAAPDGLVATTVSEEEISLTWTDHASNEYGFRIEQCEGVGCSNFAEIGTVGADVTTYNSTGLNAGTTYNFQVRAYNGAGQSGFSNTATAITAPPAPSGLNATTVSGSEIDLSWTDNASNEDGFQIERCAGGGCS